MSNDSDTLTLETSDWAASLTEGQRLAIESWQATDRFYQRVQAVVEGGVEDGDAEAVADRLLEAAIHRLSREYDAWRGVRSCRAAFGVDASDLEQLVGAGARSRRFMSATFNLSIVNAEFVVPKGAGGPVRMKMRIEAGTPIAWLPPVGIPTLAYQQELLVRPGVHQRIVAVVRSDAIPTAVVEVTP